MKDFPQRLKNLRKNRQITQIQLSEKLGINDLTYRRYESGTRNPTLENLIAIADFYGVSLDWLCGREMVATTSQDEKSPASAGETVAQTSPPSEEIL
jgi:transcriptional regulator with XRE-family HTH domain